MEEVAMKGIWMEETGGVGGDGDEGYSAGGRGR